MEDIVPLSSEQPTQVELADAVRQLQRIVSEELPVILTRLTALEDIVAGLS